VPILILKIGGGRNMNFPGIAADLAALSQPVIVVHGANAWRDDLARSLNLGKTVVTSVSGYSSVLSDESAVELLMMSYAGLQNKRLVAALQRAGVNAVGLSGLDGCVIRGRRNRGIRVRDGEKVKVLRDLSGKPEAVNSQLLDLLTANGYTPVLTMPILDEGNEAINSENDDVVTLLCRHYRPQRVLQLIEAPGLLRDPQDESSVIPFMEPSELTSWESQSTGRIKRKLHALAALFADGAPEVIIADGRLEHPVAQALEGRGTVIRTGRREPGDRP
jgi:acetylglutamate/LysW-gamma-L-alpha-aminoadipate kinase